ncbi:MAG: exosome complex protein Rrp42 [archaeon]|nr:exosome complex protein Rrp42 [Candidatus Micrarchaeota archaeon]
MSSEGLLQLKAENVVNSLKEGKRLDGRKIDEYRKIVLEKNVFANAEGSARVSFGETVVAVGVKFVLGEPFPDLPDKGTIAVGAELLPLASPTFESGPPNNKSIELARVVDRGIRESKAIDFEKLCVAEGELVWIVFIDIYAINFDGNLFDASSFGAMAAMLNARIPKQEKGKIIKNEYSGELKLNRKPLLSTFAKIGNKMVLDPNLLEEEAMDARFSVATTEDDFLSAFQKGKGGSLTKEEVDYAIDTALKQSKEIRKLL